MKKQDLFQLALMVCSFSEFFLNAQQKRNMQYIDPIIDFRVPQSLMESLQEGLNNVYVSLQADVISKSVVKKIHDELSELITLCGSSINTTRSNHVNDDDKMFLQKMLERIDQLIEQLEGNSGQSDIESNDFQSIRSLSQTLKSKIS